MFVLMLEIVYEDEYFVAINKPHGLLVHRTRIAEEKKEFAIQKLRDQIKQHVFLIHRLDRPTSGILLFAKSSEYAKEMSLLFEQRAIEKEYLAVVRGYTPPTGIIQHSLKKEGHGIEQEAETHYETLGQIEIPIFVSRYPTSRYSLVKVSPKTGRMHQIRRHFAKERFYLIGDIKHGECKQNKMFREQLECSKMLLHASSLLFIHPYTQEKIKIQAKISHDFEAICRRFNWLHLI